MDDQQNDTLLYSSADGKPVIFNSCVQDLAVKCQVSLQITDEKLIEMTIPELNRVIRNLSDDESRKIKQRRRTLKNRGYASSCRVKRTSEKEDLEIKRQQLRSDIEQLTKENFLINEELKTLQKKFDDLKHFSINCLKQSNIDIAND